MGCWKSKSTVKTPFPQSLTPQLSSSSINPPQRNLTARELDDVIFVLQMLKTENLDVYVAACAFDRLFSKFPEIKQMFINSAFLDPEHTLECATDPWLQGFLKAFINSVIKYATLQNDENGKSVFILEMKDVHQRINRMEEKHLEPSLKPLTGLLSMQDLFAIFSKTRAAVGTFLGLYQHFSQLVTMGCTSSNDNRNVEDNPMSILRRKSSNWNFADDHNMKDEDWIEVVSLWAAVRAQGAEMDITTFTFEKLFHKNPRAKVLFVDAGILDPLEEFKTDPRFRTHMREISTGLNKIIDTKNNDITGFELYVQDLLEIHKGIRGFESAYFELFSKYFHECVNILMGSYMSTQQVNSLRKFSVYLYQILSGELVPGKGGRRKTPLLHD